MNDATPTADRSAPTGNVSAESEIPYPRRVFCNRNLRLDRIRFIGFDMDYTLALYEEAMEHLQAEMVLERMVEVFGYPKGILQAAKYDPRFAIRGLAVDKRHGNVFKMDAHRFVGRVWHGDGPLEKDKRRAIYTNRKLSPADPDITMVDTLFAFPEISLYCQLVAHFDAVRASGAGGFAPRYERLWDDARAAMDSLHRDNTLKARILADIPRYVKKDPDLADMLHRFRSAGKKVFLLTNSEPHYTEAVMSYLLDGEHPAYPHWKEYFDLALTWAKKPMFFSSEDPFFPVDEDGTILDAPATTLKRGTLYVGGNVNALSRMAGLQGDDVLYVGDHIYGDILRSKRSTSWRTAMVVPEMEGELENVMACSDDLDLLGQLEEQRFQLNLERASQALDGIRDADLRDQIRQVNQRTIALDQAIAHRFNPAWGALFRDRAELSAFGAQVEAYACVYTAKASNLRMYSPFWYFRSPRDRMAHELRR